jgi:oligosaccharide repeat unit polymerase
MATIAFSPFAPANFVLLIISNFFLIRLIKRRKNPLNPVLWIWLPWAFAMTPVLFGIITYTAPEISLEAVIFIAVFLTVATLGYKLSAPKITKQDLMTAGQHVRQSIAVHAAIIDILAILGLFGATLFFIEMYMLIGVDLTNLFSTRTMFSSRQATIMSQLSPLVSWGGWVSVAAAIIGTTVISRLRRYFWFSCGLATALLSIMSAGRQTVFLLLLIVLMAYVFKSSTRPKQKLDGKKEASSKTQVILVTSAATIYMALIAILRNDDTNTTTKSEYLFSIFGITPDWEVYSFLSIQLGGIIDSVYEYFVYFSSGVSSFSAFLTGDPQDTFWGKMTFPWVARRLNFLSENSPEEALAQLAEYNAVVGAMPVGWSTSFGIYIWDFGIVGAIVFVFLVGFLSGQTWRIHNRNPSIFSLMLIFFFNINYFYFLTVPATSDSVVFFFLSGNLALVALLSGKSAKVRWRAIRRDTTRISTQ